MTEFLSLFAQIATRGSRSTALQPLLWLFGLASAGAIGSGYRGQSWLSVFFAVVAAAAVVMALFAYVYFLWHDPDALRSERFSIEKLRIEKGGN